MNDLLKSLGAAAIVTAVTATIATFVSEKVKKHLDKKALVPKTNVPVVDAEFVD